MDVGLKGEDGVKGHTKVTGLRGWGDSGTINDECEYVGSAEGGLGPDGDEFSFVTVELEKILLHPDFYCQELMWERGWLWGALVLRYI